MFIPVITRASGSLARDSQIGTDLDHFSLSLEPRRPFSRYAEGSLEG